MPGLCGRPGLSSVPFPHSQCIPPPCISPSAQFITLGAEWGGTPPTATRKRNETLFSTSTKRRGPNDVHSPGHTQGYDPPSLLFVYFCMGFLICSSPK
ncbi:hypothetical protein TNCV_1001521 [Trichonephila clavipes]|nr:hypothetical protein TNCV_1001521 [Trichonephila clavipes]